jgi:hypothetical protein
MKNSKRFFGFGIILLTGFMFVSGCKKESNDPVTPEFKITSELCKFYDGGYGLQFYAMCTNTDVNLTNVSISDPVSFLRTYDLRGVSYIKNLRVGLQENNVAYPEVSGTWKFKLVGTYTADKISFTVDKTLVIRN